MSAERIGRTLLASMLVVVGLVACRDQRPDVVDPQVQAAKKCPPGQEKKGCVVEPPPPPPGDLHLPPVVGEQLISPLRLEHTSLSWLLLTDSQRRMVLRVDPTTLQPIEGFEVDFKPLGVAGMGTSIFVGNVDGQTVDVFDADGGGFITTFGPGVAEYPTDIAADEALGRVFVLDGRRREVRVFDPSGNLVSTISGAGDLEHQLASPVAMTVDPVRQWVIVSDWGSMGGGSDIGATSIAAVKVFAYDGTFVQAVYGEGDCGLLGCSGGFSRPQSATVDASGLIYVPDMLLGEVLVFDAATWQQTNTLGAGGSFDMPSDVAFDAVGDLFIVSNRGREIQVIQGVGP